MNGRTPSFGVATRTLEGTGIRTGTLGYPSSTNGTVNGQLAVTRTLDCECGDWGVSIHTTIEYDAIFLRQIFSEKPGGEARIYKGL
jgi:hypothetical protein